MIEEAQYGCLIDRYAFLDLFRIIGLMWIFIYFPLSYFVYLKQGANFLSSPMIFILILDLMGLYAFFEVIKNR